MRTAWMIGLVAGSMVTLGGTSVPCQTADASHGRWKQPPPCINRIHRSLGFWWSDGYHAAGSRHGWTRTVPGQAMHPSSSAIVSPSWSDPEPLARPVPDAWHPREDLLPPQAELRRLPPVTRH
jgi:hypothetical protein